MHRRWRVRIQRETLSPVASHGLCVPSMGENQKGFKSPVYRMNIEKMKRTTRSQLREGYEASIFPARMRWERQTDRGEAGYGTATREALIICEAKLQSPGGIKPSGDEQTDAARSARIIAKRNIRARRDKPHTRPTEWDELAQHSETPSFSSGGK